MMYHIFPQTNVFTMVMPTAKVRDGMTAVIYNVSVKMLSTDSTDVAASKTTDYLPISENGISYCYNLGEPIVILGESGVILIFYSIFR